MKISLETILQTVASPWHRVFLLVPFLVFAAGLFVYAFPESKIIAVVSLGILSTAQAQTATTYHVAPPGTPGTSFVSCSNSIAAGCTLAKPCCSLDDADGPAAAGDTIEMHAGIYNDPPQVAQGNSCMTFSATISTPNLTVIASPGATPVIHGGNSIRGCIFANVNNLSVSGITCSNHIVGSEACRVGDIFLRDSSGHRFNNMIMNVNLPTGQGEYGSGTFRMTAADDVIIENSTLTGHQGHAFFIESQTASQNKGIIIRNNSITESGAISSANDPFRILIVKQTDLQGNIAFYNNRITRVVGSGFGNGDGPILFIREPNSTSHVYLFNNICKNCGAGGYVINTQDNSCRSAAIGHFNENVDIFNNTFTGAGSAVSGLGVNWQNYFSPMRIRNNIFDISEVPVSGATSANDPPCDTGASMHGGSSTDQKFSTANSKFTNNIVERNGSGTILSGSAVGNIDTTGSTISASLVTQRDASNYLRASTGVATNNPLGQGAGVCSLVAAGQTINCALDINGASRGTTWDVGADQFLTGTPAALPASPTNLRISLLSSP